MTNPIETKSQISPEAILAGLSLLTRQETCSMIALMNEANGLGIAKGAVTAVGRRLRLTEYDPSLAVSKSADALNDQSLSDDGLLHHLWSALNDGLALQSGTPLSKRSAQMSASALAVRASERLSPSLRKSIQARQAEHSEDGLLNQLGEKATSLWKKRKTLLVKSNPFPFFQLVEEEILNLLADKAILRAADNQADPDIAKAMAQAHVAAQRAIAVGGGWVVFAQIVGAAGFAPYMYAAIASSWIPFVGGPTLVSLLFVLTNPATLLVGVGALAWLGGGRAGSVARSQIAARLCVLLAVRGGGDPRSGAAAFVGSMRTVASNEVSTLKHLKPAQRRELRAQVAQIEQTLSKSMPRPAGPPPLPWNIIPQNTTQSARQRDLLDGATITALTAGDMLWHAAALDQNILKAADFSRSADLGDPISFAASAQGFAVDGAHYSLRGYTAELLVMDQLIADGHDVRLAPESNTPGLDLIVDGNPVQVKCGETFGILERHFEKYPDIPVIADQALTEAAWKSGADWADSVTTVPGFDLKAIEADIAATLGHAANLADPDILEFALSVGVIRGGLQVWRGAIPTSELPAWLVIDGAARGALGFVGAKGGAMVGLVALGPAGALILGPVAACAALMGTGFARDNATRLLMHNWHHSLFELGKELHAFADKAQRRKIQCLHDRSYMLADVAASSQSGVGEWIRLRATDDTVSAIEDLIALGSSPVTEAALLTLLVHVQRLVPGDIHVIRCSRSLHLHLQKRPGLSESLLKLAKPKPANPDSETARDYAGAILKKLDFRAK